MLLYLSNLFLFFFSTGTSVSNSPCSFWIYYTIHQSYAAAMEWRCSLMATKVPFAIYPDWSATQLPAESAQLPAAGKQ